jgi:hypothetical protein
MKAGPILTLLATGLIIFASATAGRSAQSPVVILPKVAVTNPSHPFIHHVHHVGANKTFSLANDAVVRLGSNPNAGLADLRVGEVAHVSYTVENGWWIAHSIVVNPPPAVHTASHSHAGSTGELHAHGRIVAYNVSSGSLTIR